MPWVMIAPLGRPVVPDVYMMVEMSSSVTTSRDRAVSKPLIAAS